MFPEFKNKYEREGHNNLKRLARYRIERAGIPARGIHCTRHTFVSRLANSGINYGTIISMTGQSMKQVATYHHVDLEAQRKAISVIGAPNI